MDFDEAKEEVERLGVALVEGRTVALAALRQVHGLQTVIRGYIEMFPDLAEMADGLLTGIPLGEGVPRGADAVRRVLHENPKAHMYVSAIVEELRDRGWLPDSENPANAIRAALERLASNPESDVYKGRLSTNVTYMYDPDRDPAHYYEEEPF